MKKIRHIVLFRLKDFAEGCTKAENAFKIKSMLEELPALIPQIKYYEVGINIIESSRAGDVSLISTFDCMDDLELYRIHPEHIKVVDFIMKVRSESWSVDYTPAV